MKLLDLLREQKKLSLRGNIYHVTQIEMAYNSNRIEGSSISNEQTRFIYETKTIIGDALVNDVVETINHFKAFDYMLDTADDMITDSMIKEYHRLLKTSTEDADKDWFNVGEYKKVANVVGNISTTDPPDVPEAIDDLLLAYNFEERKTIDSILDFHYRFECIHPFQDGNGRVGRLIMFKECLRNNIAPFIIHDDNKAEYYKGLQEYTRNKDVFTSYCKREQREYKKECLRLFPGLTFAEGESKRKKNIDTEL